MVHPMFLVPGNLQQRDLLSFMLDFFMCLITLGRYFLLWMYRLLFS